MNDCRVKRLLRPLGDRRLAARPEPPRWLNRGRRSRVGSPVVGWERGVRGTTGSWRSVLAGYPFKPVTCSPVDADHARGHEPGELGRPDARSPRTPWEPHDRHDPTFRGAVPHANRLGHPILRGAGGACSWENPLPLGSSRINRRAPPHPRVEQIEQEVASALAGLDVTLRRPRPVRPQS